MDTGVHGRKGLVRSEGKDHARESAPRHMARQFEAQRELVRADSLRPDTGEIMGSPTGLVPSGTP